MDYEKKYKEALERAKEYYDVDLDNTLPVYAKGTMEYLFPELAESDDEKIRKALIYHYQGDGCLCTNEYRIDYKDIRAWLEKQGESDIEEPDFFDDFRRTDSEVEPKFHEGDYIKHNKANIICKIISVNSGSYYVENIVNNGRIELFHAEQNFHLWTIQDANEGDVLCTYECCEPKIVFILKGTPKKHYALSYHCYYNIMYPHFASDSKMGCLAPNDEDVKPATKEQRHFLFKKMYEAGYKWDAEHKQLNKIEQKPTWSEEDEKKLLCICAWIKDYPRIADFTDEMYTVANNYIDWLKSLKDRYSWKPSDEQIEILDMVLTNESMDDNIARILRELREQLKKLRYDKD